MFSGKIYYNNFAMWRKFKDIHVLVRKLEKLNAAATNVGFLLQII
jgi:hypothetical protein